MPQRHLAASSTLEPPVTAGARRIWWRLVVAVFITAVLIAAALPPVPASAATPTVNDAGTFPYTEQEPPIDIGTGITITNGSFYDGEYIEFAPDVASADELSLATDGSADTTDGVVSIVGTSVYLGNGTTADIIGSVDTILDGQDGRALRINFTSDFVNPGFETGDIEGWTAVNQRVDLGTTNIAGCPTVDTSTYPGAVPNQDDNVPTNPGSYTSDVVTSGEPPDGQYTLQLQSTGITTAMGSDVVHGPVAYSSPFQVAAGDKIFFDWRAFAGSDAFHVFGYVIDESCNQLEVLDAVGVDDEGETNWATTETDIPASGSYRFVFVSGTYDFTGGMAAGARLLIDNVRVFGFEKASDDAVQQIARRLRYANDADNPPAAQTITVTAVNTEGNSGSDQITVNITGVDDEPTFNAIASDTLINTADDSETFTNQTGTLNATDPDDDVIGYDITGSEVVSEDIGGTTYTRAREGSYGTLYVNDGTGDFVFVPDDDAINAHSIADDTDEFTLTATAAGVTRQQTYTVTIDVDESPPGVPRDLAAHPAGGRVNLSWTRPAWLGGSAITGYRIEISDNGGGSWADVTADTGSTATSYAVVGLDNGTEYTFRVTAINATGPGVPSGEVAATPRPLGSQTPDDGPGEHASEDPPGGGTVTTDPGGEGPTDGQPVTGTVRTPVGGTVTINIEQPRNDDDIDGLEAFARAVDVEAPETSRSEPLRVTLRVEASQLPGTDEGRVVLLKDGEPVTASCGGDGANPDPCIVVRSVEGNGDLLVEVLTSKGGRFAFTEPTHACPQSLTVSGRFPGVTGTHAGAVDCITWWRPATGFTDDTYRDEVPMTRGQLASILASSLEAGGVPLPASPGTPFDDLEGSVHAEAVAQLTALGLLNGIDGDTFGPNRRLTRGQTAAILVRISEHLRGSALATGEAGRFTDIRRSVHREVIRKAAAAGFTNGYRDNSFRPGDKVTRGEGATFVVRMLDRLVDRRLMNLPL